MNEADRIVREREAEAKARQDAVARSTAAEQKELAERHASAIEDLVPEILRLIDERGPIDVHAVRVTTYRFPPLGDLFGWRTFTKGGWEIASWNLGRETPDQQIYLLSDGRFCRNGQLVKASELRGNHAMMVVGLTGLRERLRAVQS